MTMELIYKAKDPKLCILPTRWKQYLSCPATIISDALKAVTFPIVSIAFLGSQIFGNVKKTAARGFAPFHLQRGWFEAWINHNHNEIDDTQLSEIAIRLLDKTTIQEFLVGTHDGAVLSSVAIKPISNPAKHMICFPGNSYIFEMMKSNVKGDLTFVDFVKLADHINHKLILFNYRGIGLSKKRFKNAYELVIDGIAQVDHLLDDGVDPSDITLYGHSMGASIAIYVASYFHHLNKPIKVIADRTFRTTAHISAQRGFLKKFGVNFNKEILNFYRLQLTPDYFYQKIPNAYRRSYCLVKSLDKTISSKVDLISSIHDKTTFYINVKPESIAASRKNQHSTPFPYLTLVDSNIRLDDDISNFANNNTDTHNRTGSNNKNALHKSIALFSQTIPNRWGLKTLINALTGGIIAAIIHGGTAFGYGIAIGVAYTIIMYFLLQKPKAIENNVEL